MSAPADDQIRKTNAEAGHIAIVEAIAARDPQAAAAAMMTVILEGWSSIGGVSNSILAHMTLREFRPGA